MQFKTIWRGSPRNHFTPTQILGFVYFLNLFLPFGLANRMCYLWLRLHDDNDDKIIIHTFHKPTICQTQYLSLAIVIMALYYTQFTDKEVEGHRYEMTFSRPHHLQGG